MTVTAAETRVEYAGNGITAIFTYPYQFFQNDDLAVYIFDDLSEEGTKLVLGTHYNVTGAMNPSGGTVTMITFAPPAGTTLIIINDPDIVQTLHYVNADDFPADSHEHGLDRLTKICQRLSDRLDRAVRAPDYAPEDSVPDADTLLEAIERAETAADESAQSAINSEYFADQAAASAASIEGDVVAADAAAAAAAASAADAAQSAIDADVAKIIWRDHYSASIRYEVNDAVEYEGSSWISLHNDNLGNQPGLFPGQHWDLMAQKGDKGTPGTGTGDMLGANNLSDVTSTTQSRLNLGLGNSAILNVGTTTNTVAAGDDARFTLGGVIVSATKPATAKAGDIWWETDSGLLYINYNDGTSTQWVIAAPQPDLNTFMIKSDNLSGVSNVTTARQNIYAAPYDAMAYSGMQINGGMEVSQEFGTSGKTIPNAQATFVLDGWQVQSSGSQVMTGVQGYAPAYAPAGFNNSFIVNATTANAAPTAGNYCVLQQRIEGYRVARLAWGTANAQSITVSFWVRHSRAGTYSVAVVNGDYNRSYAVLFTVAAGVWEYKTVTIPGDIAGTWGGTNGVGMYIVFATMAGSSVSIAPGVWSASGALSATGTTNGIAAAGDQIWLTGVTVLPGTQAPTAAQSPNVMRPYDQELVTCKRYFYKGVPAARGSITGAKVTRMGCPHPVEMRTIPTLTMTANLAIYDGTAAATITAITSVSTSATVLEFDGNIDNAGLNSGNVASVYQGQSGNLNVDARL